MPSRHRPKGIMFLGCLSKFRLSVHPSLSQSVTMWFKSDQFISFTDIFLRLWMHIAYFWSSDTCWFPGQRSRRQWLFLLNHFWSLSFVSFTDIFLRLCIHITYVGLQIPIDSEVTVTGFVRTIFNCLSNVSYWAFAYTLPMLVFTHLLIFRSPGQRSRLSLKKYYNWK